MRCRRNSCGLFRGRPGRLRVRRGSALAAAPPPKCEDRPLLSLLRREAPGEVGEPEDGRFGGTVGSDDGPFMPPPWSTRWSACPRSTRDGDLRNILVRLAKAVASVQDPQSGVFWQVLDAPKRGKNYLEASSSSLLVYALPRASTTSGCRRRSSSRSWRARTAASSTSS
jgi:hypothetical protein